MVSIFFQPYYVVEFCLRYTENPVLRLSSSSCFNILVQVTVAACESFQRANFRQFQCNSRDKIFWFPEFHKKSPRSECGVQWENEYFESMKNTFGFEIKFLRIQFQVFLFYRHIFSFQQLLQMLN